MRIDAAPTQVLHSHAPGADLPGAGTNLILKENYRYLEAEREDSAYNNRQMGPLRLGSKVDGFERKGQAWFVATELQSDLVVEVADMSFHLHKFPLLSRSGKLNRLVFESRDIANNHIKLLDIPGGPDAFELAAKFCYGVAVELTADNVAPLRCAAEYLEMTEDLEEGNLISKTEAFLSFVVLASWKDSITVLQTCDNLAPWGDELQIVRRCCESIAWKACTDPRGIRWSYTEEKAGEVEGNHHASPLWAASKSSLSKQSSIGKQLPNDWWFEDVSGLCEDSFVKIIAAIKVKGMRHDLIGAVVMHYATKWLPGLGKDLHVGKDHFVKGNIVKEHAVKDLVQVISKDSLANKDCSSFRGSLVVKVDEPSFDLTVVQNKNRTSVEKLVGVLPPQKDTVPCTFLLQLLRMAKMSSAGSFVVADLERRAGLQLDQATLSDILIPSFGQSSEIEYDIDLVQRILEYFLAQDVHSPGLGSPGSGSSSDKEKVTQLEASLKSITQTAYAKKLRVAKLIDSYLAEVGRDQSVSLSKFQLMAEAIPAHSRTTDDGLYKAIDTYLKAHPTLTEFERKRLCRSLDCQRLSLDACMHAAQNERLPLRVVVQVLFGEQIKLRNAVISGSGSSKDIVVKDRCHSHPEDSCGEHSDQSYEISHLGHSHDHSREHSHDDSHEHSSDDHSHDHQDLKSIRHDMEKMKAKFMALQSDYSCIQQQIEKISGHKHHKHPSGWRKLMHVPHLPNFHLSHLLHPHHHRDHHHDDSHHQHHGKEHDGHHRSHGKDQHHRRHHVKDHDDHHYSHGKDHHHHKDHVDGKDHQHGKDDSDHHRGKDHHHHKDHGDGKDHQHGKDDSDHHRGKDHQYLKDRSDHQDHHHRKDPSDYRHHSKEHAHDFNQSKDHHFRYSQEHQRESQHHSKEQCCESHHCKDSHHSHQSKDHHSHHSAQHHDAHLSKDHHSRHSRQNHRDPHDTKDHNAHHSKDPHPNIHVERHDKDSDDARPMEGPPTPNHHHCNESHKHGPFSNTIRRLRNSIS